LPTRWRSQQRKEKPSELVLSFQEKGKKRGKQKRESATIEVDHSGKKRREKECTIGNTLSLRRDEKSGDLRWEELEGREGKNTRAAKSAMCFMAGVAQRERKELESCSQEGRESMRAEQKQEKEGPKQR